MLKMELLEIKNAETEKTKLGKFNFRIWFFKSTVKPCQILPSFFFKVFRPVFFFEKFPLTFFFSRMFFPKGLGKKNLTVVKNCFLNLFENLSKKRK